MNAKKRHRLYIWNKHIDHYFHPKGQWIADTVAHFIVEALYGKSFKDSVRTWKRYGGPKNVFNEILGRFKRR